MQGILYYSTISGNTRLVGEALQSIFANAGITLTLQDLAESNSLVMQNSKDVIQNDGTDFLLLACGTYGHGQLQGMMRKCCEETWKEMKLIGIPCAAIGLGDHRYDVEYNMYAADILETWLTEHGGRILVPALRINRSPVKSNNQKIIENWAKNFITTLRK